MEFSTSCSLSSSLSSWGLLRFRDGDPEDGGGVDLDVSRVAMGGAGADIGFRRFGVCRALGRGGESEGEVFKRLGEWEGPATSGRRGEPSSSASASASSLLKASNERLRRDAEDDGKMASRYCPATSLEMDLEGNVKTGGRSSAFTCRRMTVCCH